MNLLDTTAQLVARKALRFNLGVTQLASLPEFLQHLKCFDGWRVQSDPKEAVKRYYEKHPNELLKKRKPKPRPTKGIYSKTSYKALDLPPRPCEECGQMFKPRQIRSRFCSHKCSGRYHSRKQYAKLREQDLYLQEGI
jgi:hypothetical protein